jgi:uncharacterized protein YbaP (TraB family)
VAVAASAVLLGGLSWLAAVILVPGWAHADPATCKGNDMLAALERGDPQRAAEIRRQAEGTLNGKGLLWRLDRPGAPSSYLFGTMHVTDPRVTRLPEAARQALAGSTTLVIESTDVLDPARMKAALAAAPELTMFTDGTNLSSLLPPDDGAALAAALDRRGIPPASVAGMKPWMLSAVLSLPTCELARKAAGLAVLDVQLARQAEAAGKEIVGLESVADQLRAMASLPMDFHLKGLVELSKVDALIGDVVETMIVLYQRGQTAMIWPLLRAVLPEGGDDAGYAAFEEAIITRRNRQMAERAAPLLREGDAFIAVGALHLTGAEGLVEFFRRAGYSATVIR